MNLSKSRSGFSVVELIIILAVIGVLGFAGYRVYNSQDKKPATDTNSQAAEESPTANDVKSAPEIKTSDDLSKAEEALDQTDPDSSNTDASHLDSEVSAF